MLLLSSKNPNFSLHFLPSFLRLEKPSSASSTAGHSSTWSTPLSSLPTDPSTSTTTCEPLALPRTPTIHHRRTISRTNSTTPPPTLHGFADFFHARVAGPIAAVPELRRETDEECWERMISLQREYHCYKSARLEAAVEALERGCSIDEVPMREFFPFSFYSFISFICAI
jgi:hypothetical protein